MSTPVILWYIYCALSGLVIGILCQQAKFGIAKTVAIVLVVNLVVGFLLKSAGVPL